MGGAAYWTLEMLLLALPSPLVCGYLCSRVRTEIGKLAVLGEMLVHSEAGMGLLGTEDPKSRE